VVSSRPRPHFTPGKYPFYRRLDGIITITIIIIIIIIIIITMIIIIITTRYSVICMVSRYHIKPRIFIILFNSINVIKNIIDVNVFESLICGKQH